MHGAAVADIWSCSWQMQQLKESSNEGDDDNDDDEDEDDNDVMIFLQNDFVADVTDFQMDFLELGVLFVLQAGSFQQ
jgi:hypothetical protein